MVSTAAMWVSIVTVTFTTGIVMLMAARSTCKCPAMVAVAAAVAVAVAAAAFYTEELQSTRLPPPPHNLTHTLLCRPSMQVIRRGTGNISSSSSSSSNNNNNNNNNNNISYNNNDDSNSNSNSNSNIFITSSTSSRPTMQATRSDRWRVLREVLPSVQRARCRRRML